MGILSNIAGFIRKISSATQNGDLLALAQDFEAENADPARLLDRFNFFVSQVSANPNLSDFVVEAQVALAALQRLAAGSDSKALTHRVQLFSDSSPLGLERGELEKILSQNNFSPEALIAALGKNSFLKAQFESQVGHNETLAVHTIRVLRLFETSFPHVAFPPGINRPFFRLILALHDIGKPRAVTEQNSHLQFPYTHEIMADLLGKLHYDPAQIRFALALVAQAKLGAYLMLSDTDQAEEMICQRASEAGMDPLDFFDLRVIYYKVDAGSYTAFAGGPPQLEHLFRVLHGGRLHFVPGFEADIARLRRRLQGGIPPENYADDRMHYQVRRYAHAREDMQLARDPETGGYLLTLRVADKNSRQIYEILRDIFGPRMERVLTGKIKIVQRLPENQFSYKILPPSLLENRLKELYGERFKGFDYVAGDEDPDEIQRREEMGFFTMALPKEAVAWGDSLVNREVPAYFYTEHDKFHAVDKLLVPDDIWNARNILYRALKELPADFQASAFYDVLRQELFDLQIQDGWTIDEWFRDLWFTVHWYFIIGPEKLVHLMEKSRHHEALAGVESISQEHLALRWFAATLNAKRIQKKWDDLGQHFESIGFTMDKAEPKRLNQYLRFTRSFNHFSSFLGTGLPAVTGYLHQQALRVEAHLKERQPELLQSELMVEVDEGVSGDEPAPRAAPHPHDMRARALGRFFSGTHPAVGRTLGAITVRG